MSAIAIVIEDHDIKGTSHSYLLDADGTVSAWVEDRTDRSVSTAQRAALEAAAASVRDLSSRPLAEKMDDSFDALADGEDDAHGIHQSKVAALGNLSRRVDTRTLATLSASAGTSDVRVYSLED